MKQEMQRRNKTDSDIYTGPTEQNVKIEIDEDQQVKKRKKSNTSISSKNIQGSDRPRKNSQLLQIQAEPSDILFKPTTNLSVPADSSLQTTLNNLTKPQIAAVRALSPSSIEALKIRMGAPVISAQLLKPSNKDGAVSSIATISEQVSAENRGSADQSQISIDYKDRTQQLRQFGNEFKKRNISAIQIGMRRPSIDQLFYGIKKDTMTATLVPLPPQFQLKPSLALEDEDEPKVLGDLFFENSGSADDNDELSIN